MTRPVVAPTSPWIYEAGDYQQNVIRITVDFDNTTLALLGATVYRDAACVYSHIYIGLGADGTPDTSPLVFTVPAGSTNITAKQLSRQGFSTYGDLNSAQVTAGP